MKRYEGFDIPLAAQGAVVTLGTFDGVHRGHQEVIRVVMDWARDLSAQAGAITFRMHPRKVLDGRAPDLITSLEHRLVLFERLGLDFTWILPFDERLASQKAERFLAEYLVKTLKARGLVMGFDSRIGSDCLGQDSPALGEACRRLGILLRGVPPVLNGNGLPISSTKLREAVLANRLGDAEAMLGRPVSVYGTVVQGDARGRRLGYATANVDLSQEVRPPFGVYATVAVVDGKPCGSVTNVGYRPTISQPVPGERPDLMIETHLFDFDRDLYGKCIEVQFIEKIRDERRFPDVNALVEQIARDESRAREILRLRRLP